MKDPFLRFREARRIDDDVTAWLARPMARNPLARAYVAEFRAAGPDVCELLHDGRVTVCVEDAAFAYVGVYAGHVGVGFFFGALLPDPARLLEGTGKLGRHVKCKGDAIDPGVVRLIRDAVVDARARRAALLA
jgi:hypothetical protein